MTKVRLVFSGHRAGGDGGTPQPGPALPGGRVRQGEGRQLSLTRSVGSEHIQYKKIYKYTIQNHNVVSYSTSLACIP